MTLKIGFCGPNTERNFAAAQQAYDLMYDDDYDVKMIPHPLEQLVETTGKTEWDTHDLDWCNLWVTDLRRITLEASKDVDVIISPTMGLDQAAHQAAWLQELIEKSTTGLVDIKGQTLLEPNSMVLINRAGSVLQVIVASAEIEVVDIFDFCYAIVPASLGDLPKEYQGLLDQYNDFLREAPAFQIDITKLPDNDTVIEDVLKSEVSKWKDKLAASSS